MMSLRRLAGVMTEKLAELFEAKPKTVARSAKKRAA